MVYAPNTGNNTGNNRSRKIEAVSVCVNYGDFLAQTLPHNRHIFSKYVIVTDTKDKLTKRVCDFYNVTCVQTDIFYDENHKFNKARGINKGLEYLSKDAWVLHLDSDIYLPPWTKEILNNIYMDEECIYGIDRMMCHNFDEWQKFLCNPVEMHEFYYLVHARAFPVGSRVAHYNQLDGYFPIGFFQLWNPSRSGIIRYPESNDGADHTDVVFSKAFKLGNRRLLPEFYGIHLDSEKHKEMGVNWKSRKTCYFGPNSLEHLISKPGLQL